jgi:two-component system CheB/CheR fusion protein
MPNAPKKKPVKNKEKILSKNLFPVVGIGASAGGLEAFRKLLKAIPEKSGMAYIIVQHLHPEHSSSLPQILQRETNIPVHEISNNVEVAPDNIYIIPANKMLAATDGVLKLSPRPEDHKNMPIDIFFTSLAEVHQSHSIGVVLSGNGADGTKGLKNIKAHGGIAFAQDPASAAYGDMPQSAIDAGVADFILAPEKIPQQLLELDKTINKPFPAAKPATPEELTEEESYRQVLALLHIRNGVDFTYYKQTTIRRRILRRMALLQIKEVIDYQEYLKQNKQEQGLLFKDILLPVTEFFRDPKTFEYLSNTVFPELVKNKQSNTIRIWIAGCSTGEEAYSMGICLYEYLSDKVSDVRIQIFATDISEESVATARTGVYNKRQLEGVSDSRLQQFFTKMDGHYHVKKNIRNMCVFATHNFLKDPPFAKIDLVSCRNVLIYMEPFLQKKALTTFHYALNDKGYLLLGKSETTGNTDLFLSFGNKEKLFTRKAVPGRFMNVASERREEGLRDKDFAIRSSEQKRDDFQKNADDILLSKYTPPAVIVDEQFDIVQFRGSTREFLEPSPGKASLNVLKMAREGLSFELRNALHKSKTSNETLIKEGIPIDKGKKLITIEVVPLLDTIELHFLILFREEAAMGNEQLATDNQQAETGHKKDARDAQIAQLEKELMAAREDMRSITEDQEAANEELQSANEELLSGSEELQTLNEELETSKEELQSTNEELITVNQELFDRNELYNHARLYAEAIVTTIHEPLLVLAKDFRIKSANQSFYKTFQLTEDKTLGKVLFELQNNGWDIPDLRSQLIKIQTQKEKFLEWELTYTFPVVGKRTIKFNAQPVLKENDENLVLMAMEDITERVTAGKKTEESEARYHNLIHSSPSIILILKGEDLIISVVNDAMLETMGKGKDVIGKPLLTVVPEIVEQGMGDLLHQVYKTGEPSYGYDVPLHVIRNGKRELSYYTYVYQAQRDLDGNIEGVSVIGNVVTPQAEFNKKIRESEARFHLMADLMPAKVTTANPEGGVTYFNKAWLDYAGMSLKELQDFGYHQIMHPDELEEFQKHLQESGKTGTVLEMEMRFMNKDGNYRWHLNRALPVMDTNGNLQMWIGATTDIQEQKRREEEKSEFISIASHELKTPLTTAKLYIHLLQGNLSEKGLQKKENQDNNLMFVQKAEKSIERLQLLIEELLDLDKIKLGKLDLNITTFNFNDMLDDAIEEVQVFSYNHTIMKEGNISLPFKGDKDRMQQVIINLLTNAIKYSPESKNIFIMVTEEEGMIKVAVKDQGVGIKKENLNKIFDLYYREESSHSFQGFGIGLSISSEIVHRHNGKIWAENNPGKGTTVYFTLPV